MSEQVKKGQMVVYQSGGHDISAIVRTAHRDGSATVEARHYLRDGKWSGAYLGFRYRLAVSDLRVSA
jgi:hypothetical protein